MCVPENDIVYLSFWLYCNNLDILYRGKYVKNVYEKYCQSVFVFHDIYIYIGKRTIHNY